jgi:hypothetical protein
MLEYNRCMAGAVLVSITLSGPGIGDVGVAGSALGVGQVGLFIWLFTLFVQINSCFFCCDTCNWR